MRSFDTRMKLIPRCVLLKRIYHAWFCSPCAWNAQLGGARRGLPEQCMPLKILHGNAKAFEETERNTRLADGSIQKSMNQPHPLVAYRQFWCA